MLKIKLLPHQEPMVEFGLQKKAYLNRSPMGLGKSFATLATLVGNYTHILVVCPAYLITNWKREIANYTWARGITHEQIPEWGLGGVLVISYERLVKLSNKELKPVQAIVFDEAHYLANPKSGRSSRVFKYIQYQESRIQKIVFLTGTPVKQGASDLFTMLRIISYFQEHPFSVDYSNFYKFRKDFEQKEVNRFPIKGGRIVEHIRYFGINPAKKEYLKQLLSQWSVKGKLDVNIPIQRQYQTVGVPLHIDMEIDEFFDNPSMPTVKKKSALSKCDFTVKFAKEYIDNYGNVVVFSEYPLVCEGIVEILTKEGISCGMITGETPSKKRDGIIQEFTKGGIQAIVGTIGAMSTGVNLQVANVVLFNDCSYDYTSNMQAEGRITRIGQKRPCFAVYLVRDGIDSRITEIVTTKKVVVGVMDA
jgi:SNF2 family DNA or RNA helicase